MDGFTAIETPNALHGLVDPTAALQAAERLYRSCSHGLRHSGWHGMTVASGALDITPRAPVAVEAHDVDAEADTEADGELDAEAC